jgi:ABC-type Na+ transport system ATPase subunit NatA
MIHVRQVGKRFNDILAVPAVSFAASDGAITGLLGANG